ncbi:MAG: TRAP transporter small permease subunit, partial [Polynucleobacter victoriensis]
MQKFLLSIDNLSTKLGHFSAYSIAVLTAVICWEVGSRYFFNSPHDWVFDVTYMLYGVLFMMAGAYTLSKNG